MLRKGTVDSDLPFVPTVVRQLPVRVTSFSLFLIFASFAKNIAGFFPSIRDVRLLRRPF